MSTATFTSEQRALKNELINRYRDIISSRYNEIIMHINDTPIAISADVAERLKIFFLINVYPEPSRREQLDAAFDELSQFVNHPSLMWGLIGSLPMAILKFGMQLPLAIKSAFETLQAYTSAIGFERAILAAAEHRALQTPIDEADFLDCMRGIPKPELERFVAEGCKLFVTISDTTLLSKTIDIMEDVLSRMDHDSRYTEQQKQAIQLGLEMIRGGYDLLSPYDEATKKCIVNFVADTELKFIASL